MEHFLEIKKLNAGYDDIQILKDIDLVLDKGVITVLMGPNGAGKSTLLKSIFNLVDIKSGHICFKQREITGLPSHELQKKGIAFVSQGKINFDTLNVEDNVLLGAHFIEDKREINARLEEVYTAFPALRKKAKQYAFSLSGGEQQMLAIGRALMSKPELLLLDEPSLGLSPKLVRDVFEKITDIRDQFGTTMLIVEHNLKSLMNRADVGYVLVQGEVVAADSCAVLKDSAIMKKVFIGGFD